MNINLKRNIFFNSCVIGLLTLNSEHALITLEPGANMKFKDLVTPGKYDLIPFLSPSHGPTWCLHNPALNLYAGFDKWQVPTGKTGHSFVEIHVGNFPSDTTGCIIVGRKWDGDPWIEESEKAMIILYSIMQCMTPGNTITISERSPRIYSHGKPNVKDVTLEA